MSVNPGFRVAVKGGLGGTDKFVQECESLQEQLISALAAKTQAETKLELEADRRQRLQSRREALVQRQAERMQSGHSTVSSSARRTNGRASIAGPSQGSPGRPHYVERRFS